MAGISTSFYTNIERGNKGVSIFVLISLAEALNVSVESLLYQEEPRRQINNIEILLRDKPASFISAVEKMIRLCHDEFYHDSRDSHDS